MCEIQQWGFRREIIELRFDEQTLLRMKANLEGRNGYSAANNMMDLYPLDYTIL
jgi:hypothetical protein